MCFSPEASFTAGAVLSAVGIANQKQLSNRNQKLFALIPLLFGLQQFAEGFVWVGLKSAGQSTVQNAAAYIFLIAALVVWPTMIPLSMWLMERKKGRRDILAGLTIIGVIVSLFYTFCLIAYDVTPQINGFHIQYIDRFPRTPVDIVYFFYIFSTMAPLFISSVRRMWIFGILIFASYLVTIIFFSHYLTSVWCFFAALISAAIFWILRESRSEVYQSNLATGINRQESRGAG